MFQQSVLKKYLATQDKAKVAEAFARYKARFLDPVRQENIRNLKEEQFQEPFLRELFVEVLDYTMPPNDGFNLTTELKNIGNAKKTDGAILKDGNALAVIELKGTDTKDLDKVSDQAFGYKNNQPECVYVITSNFEKLRFYIQNAVEHEEFNLFKLTEERFALLHLFLQKDNLLKGIPLKVKDESLKEEKEITNRLYKDYSLFKRELWQNMVAHNPQHDPLLLYKKSQKLLDRFLFILFAEDKGLLPPNSIAQIVQHWQKLHELDEARPLYYMFQKYFGYMDKGRRQQGKEEIHAYNGGLFLPDEVLDSLTITDEVLQRHCLKLTVYNFDSEVDTNILGHIFEHSLNDIENVRAELAGEVVDKSKTKRKKDGVFYTPKYITKYIVDNTVGRLCEEKKREIGIDEEAFAKDRKGRHEKTLKRLDGQLKAYRDWLLQLTICDPACGSGAFLNQALEFLMAEHRYVDELEAQLLGYDFEFPGVEAHILEHNIYGVDINEESVEIARLSLWLRTAQKGRKLTTLSSNIKAGNSLIDDPAVAGDLAFDWKKEFPKVFGKGGFDVVIGNPPYVLMQQSNTDDSVLSYFKGFEVASYKIDLFHLFFEKSINVIRKDGRLGFITPNTYLTNKHISPLRRFILNHSNIESLVYHADSVFVDASVDVATIVLHKHKRPKHEIELLVGQLDNFRPIGMKLQSEWESDEDCVFNPKTELRINEDRTVRLGDLCHTYFGIQAFDRQTSISEEKLSDHHLAVIDGGDIFPFSIAHPNKFFDYQSQNIKSGGDWKVYSQPRVVVRQIGQTPIVGFSKTNVLASNTLYSIYPKAEDVNLHFMLAVLNSSVIKEYWLSKYSDSKLLFPKIKGYQLKELPIPKATMVEQNEVGIKSLKMLQLNESKQKLTEAFRSFVQQKTAVNQGFRALGNIAELTFPQLSKLLKDAGVALSVSQEAEWMTYFNEQKQKANALQAEIDRIDKEIDKMVHQLYGLTEEEVRIVEQV